MKWTRVGTLGAVALALALTGCSATPAANSANGGGAEALTVNLGYPGTTITRNFNPFSLQATQGTFGFQYETLFGFNILKGGAFRPWLATKYDWSDGGKKITIHLDKRANWSDGSKLTADDVVFSLDYVKKQKLSPTGGWNFDYKDATAPDPHSVEITFDQPAYAKLSSIGSITPVPKKVWQGKNGKTFLNPNPIGSGPYKLKQYSAQQLTFEARDNYWKQKDVPVKTIKAPVVTGASEMGKLLSGQVEWSGGAVPDVKKQYVDKDPKHHHAWYPTYGGLYMYVNHTKAPFDDVNVRKGLSLAVNRQELSQLGNPGMFNTLNLTGLDSKTQAKWIDPKFKDAEQPRPEIAQALKEFAKAGYTKKGNRLVGEDGKQLSFDVLEVADWGDAVQRDRVLAEQLKKVGINVQVKPVSMAQIDQKRKKAQFDVVVGGAIYYNTPYNFYRDALWSGNAGIQYNFGHYKSEKVDALLKEMENSGDEANLKRLSGELQQVMIDDVPAVPLITIGVSAEYNSKNWTGWPSAKNPYAMPAPWSESVDKLSVLLNLRPAKD